eukprot:SAG11_NODE_353_length_10348_cov_6.938335_8_plen_235_part_00
MVLGCWLAFGAFGLQIQLAPYRQPESNVLKSLVDAQIFLTFLIAFVLRALPWLPHGQEPESETFYSLVLIGSLGTVVISAVVGSAAGVYSRRNVRLGRGQSKRRRVASANLSTPLLEASRCDIGGVEMQVWEPVPSVDRNYEPGPDSHPEPEPESEHVNMAVLGPESRFVDDTVEPSAPAEETHQAEDTAVNDGAWMEEEAPKALNDAAATVEADDRRTDSLENLVPESEPKLI